MLNYDEYIKMGQREKYYKKTKLFIKVEIEYFKALICVMFN